MLHDVRGNPQAGFDRGFLAIGAMLLALLALAGILAIRDLMVWTVLTGMLWLSIGAVMVLSRLLAGKWE